MPSLFTPNSGIEKPGSGEQSGTWDVTLNNNFDIIDRSLDGQVSVILTVPGDSGSPNTIAVSDGALSNGQYRFITFTDGSDLGADAYVQLTPNDAQRIYYIRNSLSGDRSLYLFQGTYNAARDYVLANGKTAIVKFDGGGSSAATASLVDPISDIGLASAVDINGGAIDGTVIGATAPAAGTFTTLNATTLNATTLSADTIEIGGSDVQAQLDNKQGLDDALTSIAGLTTEADRMIYTTAADTYAVATITSFARTFLDDADAATARTTLGVNTLSGRNIIINGQGRINQRSYTSGDATTSSNEYTLDRWRVVTSGQSLTFTGTDAGRTMTAPAGGVEQVIEGVNIAGGTYVISWTGTATCTVDGTARVSGETFTLTADTDATVRFLDGTFTDVQVEPGSSPTAFERLPISEEIQRCQRYYWRPGVAANVQSYGTGAGTNAYTTIWFPVRMRQAPTITSNWSSLVNASGGPRTNLGNSGAMARLQSSGSGGFAATVNWTSFDAEL